MRLEYILYEHLNYFTEAKMTKTGKTLQATYKSRNTNTFFLLGIFSIETDKSVKTYTHSGRTNVRLKAQRYAKSSDNKLNGYIK